MTAGSIDRRSPAAVLLLLAVSALVCVSARADDPGPGSTTADGVYTRAQAKAGDLLYEQHCLVCHDKKYFRPVLERWEGQPLAVFYDVMSGSMPESNPGGLLDAEYLDILAYIFSRSRLPTGETPLDMGAVGELTIAHP